MYQYLSVYVIPRFHTFWNIRHNLGWSAIHVASVNGQQEILKILLENGADPDLTDEFVNIYQTAREKNLQSLDVMVAREEEFNSNLNLRANFRGCTALHYAALADDYESIRILLGMCNRFVCLFIFLFFWRLQRFGSWLTYVLARGMNLHDSRFRIFFRLLSRWREIYSFWDIWGP